MSIDATPYPLHNSSVQQKGDMAKIDHFKSKKLTSYFGQGPGTPYIGRGGQKSPPC